MTARYRRFMTGEILTITFHGGPPPGYATVVDAEGNASTHPAQDISLMIHARLLEHVREDE